MQKQRLEQIGQKFTDLRARPLHFIELDSGCSTPSSLTKKDMLQDNKRHTSIGWELHAQEHILVKYSKLHHQQPVDGSETGVKHIDHR